MSNLLNKRFQRPLVIAHRAFSRTPLEPSSPLFSIAANNSANLLECDVSVTKDAICICMHPSLLVTASRPWVNISELSYAEVCDFCRSILGWLEPILTLDELMLWCEARGELRILLDLKDESLELVPRLVATALQCNLENRLVITSSALEQLACCRMLSPAIGTCLLFKGSSASELTNLFTLTYLDMFLLSPDGLTPEIIKSAHAHQKLICAWSVNSREVLSVVLDLKVDALMTNDPSLIQQSIKEQHAIRRSTDE